MLVIRKAIAADEAAWRALWQGYLAFYDVSLSDDMTAHTWRRILDQASPLFCMIAENDGEVAGFALCVLHEATFSVSPACYLEDLFVAPAQRGAGVGRALLQHIKQRAATEAWQTLYWHTRADNPARKLYDEFLPADDFVRYRLFI